MKQDASFQKEAKDLLKQFDAATGGSLNTPVSSGTENQDKKDKKGHFFKKK